MSNILCGVDNLSGYSRLFQGKRIGLLTNPTGVTKDFVSTIKIFKENYNLTVLFSPEHGVYGEIQAGEVVDSYMDELTGIPVMSLYGKNHSASLTDDMLNMFDVLVYDIQDVGSRFYTYPAKLKQCMEVCKKADKAVVVLDRPNPISNIVEGNIIDDELLSIVGFYKMPQRYGLTIGELAAMVNAECNINCCLTVVPLKDYRSTMFWQDTGFNYINASPNLPNIDAVLLYNGTCIFEGTAISEGRGTTHPFEQIGSPEINPFKLADIMNGYKLPGVHFRPTFFTPMFSKYSGSLCKGVQIHILDHKLVRPVKLGLILFVEALKMSRISSDFFVRHNGSSFHFIDLLAGNKVIRNKNINLDISKILDTYEQQSKAFKSQTEKFKLYHGDN